MAHPILIVLCCCAAAAAVRAQAVLTVGPGGFPTIPAALAVANPGDLVDIAAGTYPAFDCGVGVTLRATAPGSVQFDLARGFLPGTGVSMQFAAPPGQTLHVVGVRFLFPEASPTIPDVQPQLVLGSTAVLEDCTLTSALGNAKGSLRIGPAAGVHLQNPAFSGLPIWLHGLSGWSFPLQVAPPAGGVLR